jgi:hypothetical protein
MFGTFFRFELRYQLGSPLLWLVAAVFGLLAFGATSTDAIRSAARSATCTATHRP